MRFTHPTRFRRLFLESLEERSLLAVITVTRMDDAVGAFDGVTLREAIQAANTNTSVDGSTAGQPGNDLINFAPGLSGTISLFGHGQLTVTEPLFITGNGAAQTVIDAVSSSRVLDIASTAGDVTISGVKITGGTTTGAAEHGGGIRSQSTGTLTIQNSIIVSNSTKASGTSGGGVYSEGDIVIIGSTIDSNKAAGFGGGIYAKGSLKLTNSTINNNEATDAGGALGVNFVTATSSTISNNRALTGVGGGVASGFLEFTESTISGNEAALDGGGLYVLPGPVSLAAIFGGTIYNNKAERGGGINGQFGSVILRNSIVAGNVDSDDGGTSDIDKLSVDAKYSLIGDNTDTGLMAAPVGSPDSNHNLIGTHLNPIDPKLASLANNGGPTKTHALLADSPAIDAASNESLLFTPTSVASLTNATDLWKATRLIDSSGFDSAPSLFNYATDSQNQQQDTAWVTDAFFPDYYTGGGAVPELTFQFDDLESLSSIVVWGYNPFGVNDNEAKTLELSFSTDGGATFGAPLTVTHARTAAAGETLSFGGAHLANAVKVRVMSNYNGEPGAGGGDRVGLGEIRFLGLEAGDQRGLPFDRVVATTTDQADMGAFEKQTLNLVVTTGNDELDPIYDPTDLSLREALTLANANPGTDTIMFAPGLNGQGINVTLGALPITDSVQIFGNGPLNTFIDAQQKSRVFDIASTAGNVEIDGVTVAEGKTTGAAEHGGGIRSLSAGTLTIRGSTFTGNTTTGVSANGGAIYAEGIVNVTNSTFSGNGAGLDGGGIYTTANLYLTNSTISGNGAGRDGGGIDSPLANLSSSTIAGNSAVHDGGGIFAGFALLTNSIVATNTDNDGSSPDIHTTVGIAPSYSLIGDNSGTPVGASPGGLPDSDGDLIGQHTARIDPRLAPLADNGGPTLTRALLPDSPAIDAGNDFLLKDALSQDMFFNDQRGGVFFRIANFTVPNAPGIVDMGAYEAQSLNLVVTTTNDELDSIYDANDLSLREALALANVNPGPDTIGFSSAIDGQPIVLTLGQLEISDGVTIEGNAALSTTIIGSEVASRLLDITEMFGDVTLENLTLTNGATTGAGQDGGAIRSLGLSTLTIRNTTLSNNGTFGASKGGAIYSETDTFLIGCSIWGNSSGLDGGGIYVSGQLTVVNSTISGNGAARDGGGIEANSLATFINSTITDNSAADEGGGIFAFNSVKVRNTIVAGNHDTGNQSSPDLSTHSISVEFSLIGDKSGTPLTAAPVGQPDANGNLIGTAAAKIDPKLGPLAMNGGPTKTHALLPGSPAIDAGNSFLAIDPITQGSLLTDQRGVPFRRVVNAADPNGLGTIDMGAFERQTLSLVVTTNEDEFDAVFDPADLSLREALALADVNPGADTITFSPALNGQPLLTLGQLSINDDVTIRGNGQDQTIIDAQHNSRVFDSNYTATDVTLDSVTIRNGLEIEGGGIRFQGSGTLSVLNSKVVDNNVEADGGGIFAHGKVAVVNSEISGNYAGGGDGGGISSTNAVSITNSSFINNQSNRFGGGVYVNANTVGVTVTNSTFSGNYTEELGGAIYAEQATLVNSTITDNTSQDVCGGIYMPDGELQLFNSIVAGNHAGISGGSNGGPDIFTMGSITAQFSFIGDNTGSGLTAPPAGTRDGNGNFIGTGAAPIDPKLAPLTYNGGAMRTHRPLPGSPVIDAGNNNLALDAVTQVHLFKDQRGLPRFVNGTVDMGAIEVGTVPFPLIVTTADDELDAVATAADLSLREAIALANGSVGTDTITFAPALNGQPLLLSLGQLEISDSVTITGNGIDNTVIDAQQQSRVFYVFSSGGDVTFDSLTVRNGNATNGGDERDGGGILSKTLGTLNVRNSVITGNVAAADATFGGGIFALHDVTIANSTIDHNSADGSGGGVQVAGKLTAVGSTISDNNAGGNGGGISGDGDVYVLNTTISGNTSVGNGGGIIAQTLTVVNSTVTANTTHGNGGGLFGLDDLPILNSIVAGNQDLGDGSSPDFGFATKKIVLNSLIGDNNGTGLDSTPAGSTDTSGNLVGSHNAPLDPRLGPLANNGGLTQTHALLPDSPAIDRGHDFQLKDPFTQQLLGTDQRGMPFQRLSDGPDADTVADIDMGAYESQALSLLVTTNSDELDTTYDAADLSLREALALSNANPLLDTITFNPSLSGQTIALTLGELHVSNSVTIQGLGADKLTISGGSGATQSRVFNFEGGGANTYILSGLTIRDGNGVGSGLNATGGAILLLDDDDRLVITDSVIRDSHLDAPNTSGGGITALLGALSLTNVTIMNNSAAGGAGLVVANIDAFLTNVTVSRNKASQEGGGILISAGNGLARPTNLRLINSTIAENTSPLAAGIDELGDGASAVLTLGNSIVANNTGGGAQFAKSGSGAVIVSLGHNISSDNSGTLTNTGDEQNTDPKLGPLGDNGGGVPTQALLLGSPAIDAGNNAFVQDPIAPLLFDQRGSPFQRVVDGPDADATATVDIGAFEYFVNHAPTCLIGLGQITDDEQGLQSVPNWLINCSANDAGQQFQITLLTDRADLFTKLPAVDASGTLTFDPAPNVHGLATITVVIADNGGTASGGVDTTTVPVQFSVAKIHRLFNAAETGARRGRDVTGSTSAAPDGFIVAQDVITVINYINSKGSGKIPDNAPYGPPYVDVTGDNTVAADDVIAVINYINAHPGQREGESAEVGGQMSEVSGQEESLLLMLAADVAGAAKRRR